MGTNHSASSGAALIILEGGEVRTIPLEGRERWIIGRGTEGCTPDIPLHSPIAGRRHGELFVLDGSWFFRDGGSLNGTFLNGQKLPSGGAPVMLRSRDILRIDYQDLRLPDPRGVWMLFSAGAVRGQWQYAPLEGCQRLTIGRDPRQCQIVQSLPYVSARHAELIRREGGWTAADCGSTCGTWHNGHRLGASEEPLSEKDCLFICDCCFLFTGDGLLYNDGLETPPAREEPGGDVLLTASIASKTVPDRGGRGRKELLRSVRLELRAGRLTALLGGSGAGKSTLMNCLSGMDREGVAGQVLFRGEDLYQNYERLKYFIGTVPQDNVLHPALPVEEELRTAARLYLPRDTSREELERRVDRALASLNLEAKRRDQIRKLSGGERKRVNIGVELVADRTLLCLDEPDAGLDPSAKDELFRMLRRLAREEGRCILTIIHDVSEIDLFDQVIMMAKVEGVGRLAYAGTPEGARAHFQVADLGEAYARIEADPKRYAPAVPSHAGTGK